MCLLTCGTARRRRGATDWRQRGAFPDSLRAPAMVSRAEMKESGAAGPAASDIGVARKWASGRATLATGWGWIVSEAVRTMGLVSSCRVSHGMFQVPRQRQFTHSRLLSGRSNPNVYIVDTAAERILFSPPARRLLLRAY